MQTDVNDSWVWGQAKYSITKMGDRRDGDWFTSYQSNNYELSNYWTVSDNVSTSFQTITDITLQLDGSSIPQTALYKGSDGSYVATSAKVFVDFDKSASTGNFDVRFRRQDENNFYSIKFDLGNDEVCYDKTVASSTTIIATAAYTFAEKNNKFNIVFNTSSLLIYDDSSEIIDSNDNSIEDSGEIELHCNGVIINVDRVRLFEVTN